MLLLISVMQPQNPKTNGHCDDLSLKEAAAIVGMHWMWLYRRIGKPKGPPYKKRGGRIKIPRAAFLQWNEQQIIP